jgi:hypothetical protein
MYLPPEVLRSSFLRPVMRYEALLVDRAEVARVEPALGVERVRVGVGAVQVAAGDVRALRQDLAVFGELEGHPLNGTPIEPIWILPGGWWRERGARLGEAVGLDAA